MTRIACVSPREPMSDMLPEVARQETLSEALNSRPGYRCRTKSRILIRRWRIKAPHRRRIALNSTGAPSRPANAWRRQLSVLWRASLPAVSLRSTSRIGAGATSSGCPPPSAGAASPCRAGICYQEYRPYGRCRTASRTRARHVSRDTPPARALGCTDLYGLAVIPTDFDSRGGGHAGTSS